MKAISIWQPFATLVVKGFKTCETRSWPAPASIVGQRIAIASTKKIHPSQKSHFTNSDFRSYYDLLGLPDDLKHLKHGYMLGTVIVDSNQLITEEYLDEVSPEEKQYGWWSVGNYAWRLRSPIMFDKPIPVTGAQGIYEWKSDVIGEESQKTGEEGATVIRGNFRPS